MNKYSDKCEIQYNFNDNIYTVTFFARDKSGKWSREFDTLEEALTWIKDECSYSQEIIEGSNHV